MNPKPVFKIKSTRFENLWCHAGSHFVNRVIWFEYIPVLGFDIDKLQSFEQVESIIQALQNWKHSMFVCRSLSGFGIRLLVHADSSKENHKLFYDLICSDLSRITGVKLKSKIREGLKIAGFKRDQIKEQLTSTAHIDDSCHDIARFWYYAGIPINHIWTNEDSDVYKIIQRSNQDGSTIYQYEFTEDDKIEYLVDKIERSGIDITAGVIDWFKIGLSLADEFSEYGRSIFHAVSKYHPDYKSKKCDAEYDRCLNKKSGKVKIATFYKFCQDYGVGIDFSELAQNLKHKFPTASTVSVTVDQQGHPLSASVEEQAPEPLPQPIQTNTEAERAIVSRAMTDNYSRDLIFDHCPRFSSECFTDQINKTIFQAIEQLIIENKQVSLLTVASRIQVMNPSMGLSFLQTYSRPEDYHQHIQANVDIVYSSFVRSKLLNLASSSMTELMTKHVDVFEFCDQMSTDLSEISNFGISDTERTLLQIGYEALKAQAKRIKNFEELGEMALLGVQTGFKGLDKLTLGYQGGQLIIRAARPGMGKTASMLRTAIDAAKELKEAGKGEHVGILSCEMPKMALFDRMASMESEVLLSNIKTGNMTEFEQLAWYKAREELSKLPIIIDDRSSQKLSYARRVCSRWKRKHKVKLVIGDYLGIFQGSGKYRGDKVRETGEISAGFKAIAKDNDIAVLMLCQLSRAVETRGGSKRPQLSDLRDSGNIEQDADVVEFLYRAEYYNILEDEEGQSLKGVAEIIVAKARDGALGTAYTRFEGHLVRFKDDEFPDFWNNGDQTNGQVNKIPDEDTEGGLRKTPPNYEIKKDNLQIIVVDDISQLDEELNEDAEPEVISDHDAMKAARERKMEDDDIPFD